jgi:hypothetical protein
MVSVRHPRFARAAKAGLAASVGLVAACNAILGISDRAVVRSKGPGTPICGDASSCREHPPPDGGPSATPDSGKRPLRDASLDGPSAPSPPTDAEAGKPCDGANCADVVTRPPPVCAANQTTCTGSRLEHCNADGTGYTLVEECEAGTCSDNNQLQCPLACGGDGTSCLDDHTLRKCTAGGQIATDTPCETGKPFCIAGVCVECKTVGDCTSPDLCHTVKCQTGVCTYTEKTAGDLCSLDGGYCNAKAECVACLDATTCRASGECFDPTCTATGSCGQKPSARGQVCANGVKKCDGAGACVECLANGDCSGTEVCRNEACANAVEDIGLDTVPSGSTDTPVLGNWLYVFRLPALTHDATLHSFGVIGDSTSTNATVALALYADDGTGNAPAGAGIAATQSPIPIATVAKEVNAAPGNQQLTAGATYWIGIVSNAGTNLPSRVDDDAVSWRTPLTFGNAFPSGQAGTPGPSVDLPIYIKVVDTD